MKCLRKLGIACIGAVVAGPALAHTGHGSTAGLAHGLMHPVLGPDHLLAMLAVGLWSGFALPNRVWAGAVTFLAAMVAGAGLSGAGIGFAMVETWVTLSVVAFGLLTIVSRPGQSRGTRLASLAAIALFAAAHGHAHATEAAGSAAFYFTGFLISTTLLHLAGIGLARAVTAGRGARLVQTTLGTGIAAGGLALVAG
jgi:urease accessory protein